MHRISESATSGPHTRVRLIHARAAAVLAALCAFAVVLPAMSLTAAHVLTTSPMLTSHVYRLGTASSDSLHAVYSLHQGNGDMTLEMWAQVNRLGAIGSVAITGRDTSGSLVFRSVIKDNMATTYTARTNNIQQASDHEIAPLPFDKLGLNRLVQAAHAGSLATVAALGRQTIDGHDVDAVSIDEGQGRLILSIGRDDGMIYREVFIGSDGRTQWSLNLVLLETIAAGADTFSLNAPTTAHQVVTPDGSPLMGTQELSVAQLVSYPKRPSLVLQGDPMGLTLRDARYTGFEHDAVLNSMYQSAGQAFYVSAMTTDHGLPDASDQLAGLTKPVVPVHSEQDISLSVAGTALQGHYYEVALQQAMQPSRVIDFAEGEARLRLTGDGMSRDEFFAVINALVNGRTRPDVVAHLQQELSNAMSMSR